MNIKFPLLSILSVGFLLFFMLQGGDVELHSIEVGFSADSQGATVTIDPAFVVYTDNLNSIGLNSYPAGSIGNVIFMRSYYKLHPSEYLWAWESNHLEQYRALGLWYFLAWFTLPVDPAWSGPFHYDDPTEPDSIMWLPTDEWTDQWHFISVIMLYKPTG